MINYQTKILEEQAKQPTKLDLERIILQRTPYPSNDARYSLKRKEAGAAGEELVYNYLNYYGKDDWIVARNIWLNNGTLFEGDFILLTNHMPYLFEVKNYSTDYIYEDGVSTWNDNRFSGNPINQTRSNTINLENIFNGFKVQGILTFIGNDNYVEINSEISDIKIIKRNELKRTILKIAEKDDEYNGKSVNNKFLLRQLETYETFPRQQPTPLTDNQISKLQKGIYCLHCKSFNVNISRKSVSCPCGFIEEREIAILRTICEYGVLTFDKNLKVGKLEEFFGGDASRYNIRKILNKYFIKQSSSSHTSYINRVLPLEKLYEILKIDSTINLTMSYQEYNFLMKNPYR
jgi:hypothetical protein